MEVNVQAIERKCRLCARDQPSESTTNNIFSTCGLHNKIRKYLQITITHSDYLPKIVCEDCYVVLERFEHLCVVASGAQKELLLMLNNNTIVHQVELDVELQNKKKRRRRKKIIEEGEQEKKQDNKKRRRRNKRSKTEDEHRSTDIRGNFKLGQIIRDTELIKLIMKALKLIENDENLERLRNTDLADVLNNSNLLHDEDLIRLIKSYMVHDKNNNRTEDLDNLMDESNVTEIEIKVDPSLFLPDEDTDTDHNELNEIETDDSRTISVDLNEIMANIIKEEDEIPSEKKSMWTYSPFECTSCPMRFPTHVQMQDHVLTHLIKRSQDAKKKQNGRQNKNEDDKHRNKPDAKEKENDHDPSKKCSYCNKQFKRRQDLKFHINQHTGERPFQCVSCPKAFASSGNCLTHKKRMHPELFPKKNINPDK